MLYLFIIFTYYLISQKKQNGILDGTAIFYCINTTSHAAWGTLPALMQSLFELGLEVIDHRSWHSKFESTVINEVYVKGILMNDDKVESQIKIIKQKIKDGAIRQDVSNTFGKDHKH